MTVVGTGALSIIRRVILFPLVRIPLLGGILFVGMGISNGFLETYHNSPPVALALVLVVVAAALAIYWAFVRFVERRPVSELSLSGAGGEIGAGLVLGFSLYSACIFLLFLMGHYRVEGLNPWTAMLAILPMVVSSAFMEELIHRGVLFRVTEEYLGSWNALAVTSAIFGARHLGNPDATVLGAMIVAVEAGLLLAAAYMLTRRLWFSIGLHMAWNFAQAAVFSGTVSGVEMPQGLLKAVVEGPHWMTGGQFGVEASIIAFALCTVTGLVLLRRASLRGRVLSPMWVKGS